MPSADKPEIHTIYPVQGFITPFDIAVYPDGRLGIWDTDNAWWTPLNVRLPQPQREAA